MKIIASKVYCAGILSAALFACTFFYPFFAAAAEKSDNKKITISDKMVKSDSPIHISADRMEVKQEDRTLVFEGHVQVRQDDLTLTGNRIKVFAAPSEKKDQASLAEKIDYIEVTGNVRVTQKDGLATAEKAVFYQQEQKIVMQGNPTVSKGNDKIEGTLITIYIQQGKSTVEGGRETPVQAVLHPAKKE